MVAVKMLEKVVEEEVREFKAEITTIGRTHHRNLLQLLGFCIEGSRKLLVYEYISNGSLAHLLFNKAATMRPSWRERVGIVLDVAKGVLYLHEECGVHIIHCNLKPHNILLDHSWTAKSEEVDKKTLENMVKVGLRCIQDEPALRPSMKSVVLMLQGITDIAIPPCPTTTSM
ncbi:G-type lectin S-receptor-like serine/threonine-protein kinase LECRK3 [Prunus yedoensis var. nudiflora]|uniref:G-type lectin S-receptor-like serine/threonine-protein kinase LECRK3 n=1 Tax=Prunus yedoensis var. nudiflora TaxID=2094558 RepID=A0A314YGV6_PRUYE|nr:G-type lectin S-receptor-like serine/threonine-protein kinase LECRK3 [Prunus yedoensis var. nudiflora]